MPESLSVLNDRRQRNGQFGPSAHSEPEVALALEDRLTDLLRGVVPNSDDEDGRVYNMAVLGVNGGNYGMQALTWTLVSEKQWSPSQVVPMADIVGTVQNEFLEAPLRWYVQHGPYTSETWDDQPSFYGADGPLGIHADSGIYILDGCHRYLAARLSGALGFRLQLIDVRTRD